MRRKRSEEEKKMPERGDPRQPSGARAAGLQI